jgi:predicted Mrr-cat superfamily restriction endonuclease
MTNVWVIRSLHGKYAGHFVDGSYVGAGWLLENDLSKVKTRDELSAIYRQAHPQQSPQEAGSIVGQLWLFLEMGVGDYVITPCSDSQWLYYGRVVDLPYYYAPDHPDGCDFPHRRPVAWNGVRINRSDFSEAFQSTLKFTQKTAFRFQHIQEFLERTMHAATFSKYSIDEVCDRGEKIYSERIKALLEPLENGKFIVIDIESGDYEVDDEMLAASLRLRERRPDSVGFGGRVGYDAAYHIGCGLKPVQ